MVSCLAVVMVKVGSGVSERSRGNVGSCSPRFRAAVIAAGGRVVCWGVGCAAAGGQPAAAGSVSSFSNAALSASVHGQAAGSCSLPRRPENASRAPTCNSR